jgi:hypothetical protein
MNWVRRRKSARFYSTVLIIVFNIPGHMEHYRVPKNGKLLRIICELTAHAVQHFIFYDKCSRHCWRHCSSIKAREKCRTIYIYTSSVVVVVSANGVYYYMTWFDTTKKYAKFYVDENFSLACDWKCLRVLEMGNEIAPCELYGALVKHIFALVLYLVEGY